MAGPEDLKPIGGEGLKKPSEPKGPVKGPEKPEKKWSEKKDDKEGLGTPDKDQTRKDVPAPKKAPEEETPEAKPEEAKTTAPRIPEGPSEEEDKPRQSPMGETPLEGTGKVTKGVGKAGEGIGKAGELAGDITSAAGAPEVGEPVKWVSKGVKYTGKAVKKGGEKMEEAGQKAAEEGKRADEDEEDVEDAAKIAAEKGKKKLKWLKWPAIIGGVGCVGCGCIAALIGLVIMIVVVVTGGGGDFGAGVRDMLGLGDGVYLNQTDSPWGSEKDCNAISIGLEGCAITTAAMALRSIGIDTNPSEIASIVCDHKKDANWGLSPGARQAIADHYKVKLVEVGGTEGIGKAVNEGHAVGIWADPAESLSVSNPGMPHSVLVVGVDGDTLTVMDPSDPNGKGKSGEENITRTCSLSDWANATTKFAYYYAP